MALQRSDSSLLAVPRLPRVSIPRKRLLDRLRKATAAHVTLVVAAAGSGKSVLLAQLATSEVDKRVVWLALDSADKDASHLGHHILEGLRSVVPDLAPEIDQHIHRAAERLGPEVSASLTQAMSELPRTLVIIEDLQVLSDELQADVAALIDRAPDDVHFVVSSRVDPSALFVRLEIGGHLERLGQADLALSAREEAQLIERVSGVVLSEQQCKALHERTEGWAAATQVAGLALRDHVDVDTFLKGYQGADHDLARYLDEVVVKRQTPEVQEFLLRTSVVDRFSAPLCILLTGRPNSQQIIDDLDQRSLLVVRLDNWHEWFRYHHLLVEMLRSRLEARHPGLARELLVKAAGWHVEQGDLFTAGELYTRAEAWDELWDLVINRGWELQEQGYVGSTVRWTRSAPRTMVAENQRAALAVATQARISGNSVACEVLLAGLEKEGFTDDYARMWVEMLHCIGVQFEEPLEDVLAKGEVVRAWLATDPPPPTDPELSALETPEFIGMETDLATGRAFSYLDRFEEGRPILVRASEGHSYWSARVGAKGSLAHLDARAGELGAADAGARAALTLAHEAGLDTHESCADAYLTLGIVARERDELDVARQALEEAGRRASSNRRTALITMQAAELALLDLAMGKVERGLERAVEMRHEVEARVDPAIAARLAASEAKLWLAQHRPDRAEWLVDRSMPTIDMLPVIVEVALLAGDVARAKAALDSWPVGALRLKMEKAIWSAALVEAIGDEDASNTHMVEALNLAEHNGHVRTFVDAGSVVAAVVERCAKAELCAYASAVADAAQRDHSHDPADVLTSRELAILQQLATVESNREIARTMYISPNTLKTHLRRIYRKLGVSGRREAVERAVRLGIIERT